MKISMMFLLLFSSVCAYGQDERLLRGLLSGEAARERSSEEIKKYHFLARSPRYLFDIDGDDRKESFYFSKQDGEDWLYLFDRKGKELFRYQFDVNGPKARAYKMDVRYLSKDHRVFLIHFYEGYTNYLEFRGNVRLYMLTIDKNNLSTLNMFKGPYLWDEYKSNQGHYHQRRQKVSLFDFNKDGIRDLSVRFNHITEVFQYFPGGKWKSLNKL